MNKYGVKALEYDRWNNELYKQVEERCNSLVGQKFYVEKADTYITVIDWFNQECNIAKGTKAVILVFVCDKEMKEPEKVLPEVLKF